MKKSYKKQCYKMSQYFPPYNSLVKNIKTELDLSNYVTKDDKVNENEKIISITKGFFYYTHYNYLIYQCKINSFNYSDKKYQCGNRQAILEI